MTVIISRTVLDQIRALAAADSGEVCGLLLGAARRIDACLPAANVAPDPARHFELDPKLLIAAHRAARAGGPQVLGHYHSHPSGVPVPSATDIQCAVPDGSLWLIVAGGGQARLWIARGGDRDRVDFAESLLDIR